jgi:CheY-like chemotaxis protein
MQPASGLDLLRRKRTDPATISLPFILMTADASPELPCSVRKLGADGFLRKPFTTDIARRTIVQAVAA